jgi:ATP-binding cassette subfamily C protein
MGMIPEGVQIWGRETAESLKAHVIAQDRNTYLAGVSKMVRLSTQVAILGWGAWLALHDELTGGMVIAASIVASRALAPLEGTIEGWRGFVHARSAYARIKSLLQNSPLNLERLRLPNPAGRLTVERILYVPPPSKKVILNGVSFQLEPGESLAIVGRCCRASTASCDPQRRHHAGHRQTRGHHPHAQRTSAGQRFRPAAAQHRQRPTSA